MFGLGHLGALAKKLKKGLPSFHVFGFSTANFIGASTAAGTFSAIGAAVASFIGGSTAAGTFSMTGTSTASFVGPSGGGFTPSLQFNDARNSQYTSVVGL